MKRILSVDWDYFIKATAAERFMLFPDGGNEDISRDLQLFIWNSRYAFSPQIQDIGVLEEDLKDLYYILDKFGEKYRYSEVSAPQREVLITISHKWAHDFVVNRTKPKETFEVYNVDFHHDMYHFKLPYEEVNCGNWVNKLLEVRPNMQYFWVKREDSDLDSIGGEKVSCQYRTMQEIKDLDFDYIFICRSDCWSPPHLDKRFDNLWKHFRSYIPIEIENGASVCRKLELPSKENEQEAEYNFIKMLQENK